MADPIEFPSVSPRFQLPLLFTGQAQKEFFVNQSFSLTDLLLHAAVEGETDTPPLAPLEGECWLVGANPTGAWTDQAGMLAGWTAGSWMFANPQSGMRLFDRSTGQILLLHNGWQRPVSPTMPSGGAVVDAEIRTALADLTAALQQAGILA